jgi:hypothetical protein
MALLTRRPRCVYEVYTEEEYLAGADLATDREASLGESSAREVSLGEASYLDLSLPREPAHKRGLRRLAGAAALTGAVGAVGTVLGLALLRAEPTSRDTTLAQSPGPQRHVHAGRMPGATWTASTHAKARSLAHTAAPTRGPAGRVGPRRVGRRLARRTTQRISRPAGLPVAPAGEP